MKGLRTVANEQEELGDQNGSKVFGIIENGFAGELTQVLEEIEKVLELNDLLTQLSNHSKANEFALGVGQISLLGGEYDTDRKADDLKLLYRAFVSECFSNGRLEEKKLVALKKLKNIFGLGIREGDAILLDITTKVYRKRLSQAVSGGDLESASSKAAYLQNLCDELHFDPEKASKIHEEIYRQKLQQYVSNGELGEEDVAFLLRIRVLLCITQETVDAAHADICGQAFEKVVTDAIGSGPEGYDTDARESVRKAAHGLRLTTEAAMAIASKAVRKMFLYYVRRSKGTGNRTEAARELKKMIAFNILVVTKLLSDIKGEPISTPEEPRKDEAKKVEEVHQSKSLMDMKKLNSDKQMEAVLLSIPGQKEITVKDDLPEKDRAELYRTYLHFCISGEVVTIPFGVQITTKMDKSRFVFLNQLGQILGLTGSQIGEIHRNLAEQSFMKRAEVILADGQLTKSKIDQLNEAQKQIGLPAEYAQKIIKNITTTKMAAAIETAVSQGRIGIQQVRELKEASVDLDSMMSEKLRESLFRKIVQEILSSGKGVFDEEEVYVKLPDDLSIDPKNAKGVAQDIARNRLSNSLVQAIALLRQRKRDGV
ncbi:hypothetical protein HPP92_014541, partial [Vanilla planifolia]